MLVCIIMEFLNRTEELDRLDRLATSVDGGLAVVYGRRRIGKTRLLLEWSRRHGGLYTVADQSAPEIQRRYFSEAVAQRLPGFADVEYRDWRRLLSRLAREARIEGFRGPVIFDELPYLVVASPEMPSVLQHWIDHEAREARLVTAVAGSSQRMMQGLVLSREAPLFGRAREVLELRPIDPVHLRQAFRPKDGMEGSRRPGLGGPVPAAPAASGWRGRTPRTVGAAGQVVEGDLHRVGRRQRVARPPSPARWRGEMVGSAFHRQRPRAARPRSGDEDAPPASRPARAA